MSGDLEFYFIDTRYNATSQDFKGTVTKLTSTTLYLMKPIKFQSNCSRPFDLYYSAFTCFVLHNIYCLICSLIEVKLCFQFPVVPSSKKPPDATSSSGAAVVGAAPGPAVLPSPTFENSSLGLYLPPVVVVAPSSSDRGSAPQEANDNHNQV